MRGDSVGEAEVSPYLVIVAERLSQALGCLPLIVVQIGRDTSANDVVARGARSGGNPRR
jgi:hypothetical protein